MNPIAESPSLHLTAPTWDAILMHSQSIKTRWNRTPFTIWFYEEITWKSLEMLGWHSSRININSIFIPQNVYERDKWKHLWFNYPPRRTPAHVSVLPHTGKCRYVFLIWRFVADEMDSRSSSGIIWHWWHTQYAVTKRAINTQIGNANKFNTNLMEENLYHSNIFRLHEMEEFSP